MIYRCLGSYSLILQHFCLPLLLMLCIIFNIVKNQVHICICTCSKKLLYYLIIILMQYYLHHWSVKLKLYQRIHVIIVKLILFVNVIVMKTYIHSCNFVIHVLVKLEDMVKLVLTRNDGLSQWYVVTNA